VGNRGEGLIQCGDCAHGHCRQFSISISNDEFGLTIRFESEEEFTHFIEEGDATQEQPDDVPHTIRGSLHEVSD
jgi:hypothetical protein